MCIQVHQKFACKDVHGKPVAHSRMFITRCSTPNIATEEILNGARQQPCLEALDDLYQEFETACPDCTGKHDLQDEPRSLVLEYIYYAHNKAAQLKQPELKVAAVEAAAHAVQMYCERLVMLMAAKQVGRPLGADDHGHGISRKVVPRVLSDVYRTVIPELFCWYGRSHLYGGARFPNSCCACEASLEPGQVNIALALRRTCARDALEAGRYAICCDAAGRHAVTDGIEGTDAQIAEWTAAARTCQSMTARMAALPLAAEPHQPGGRGNPFAVASIPFNYQEKMRRKTYLERQFSNSLDEVLRGLQIMRPMAFYRQITTQGTRKERVLWHILDIIASDVGLTLSRAASIVSRFVPLALDPSVRLIAWAGTTNDKQEAFRTWLQLLARLNEVPETVPLRGPDGPVLSPCETCTDNYSGCFSRYWMRAARERAGEGVAEASIVELSKDKVEQLVAEQERCPICFEEYLDPTTHSAEMPVRLMECARDHHAGRRCLTSLARQTMLDKDGDAVARCPQCRVPFLEEDDW